MPIMPCVLSLLTFTIASTSSSQHEPVNSRSTAPPSNLLDAISKFSLRTAPVSVHICIPVARYTEFSQAELNRPPGLSPITTSPAPASKSIFESTRTSIGWTVPARSGFMAETRFAFIPIFIPGLTKSSPDTPFTACERAASRALPVYSPQSADQTSGVTACFWPPI